MSNWLDRIRAAYKAFRLGPAVVQPQDMFFGKDSGTFSPEVYAEYIAKSVGVYACVNLRANSLASLPLRLYKVGKDGKKEAVGGGPLFDLLQKVNPYWTLSFLLKMTEHALDLWGQAFWILERGQSGRQVPREIWWANPSKMKVVTDPVNYVKGFIYDQQGTQLAFTPDEVIWLRNPNPIDEFAGLAPIAAARLSIDLGIAGLHSNKKLFDQGMQLGGVISPASGNPGFTAEQAKLLDEMLAKRFRGVDKAHKWLIAAGGELSIKEMGVNPRDAEFIGQMQWSLADICRVYQVPPILVQDLDKSTYSNFEQSVQAFWSLCMVPQAKAIADQLTEQLLPKFPGMADCVEFDLSEVAALQEAEDAKWTREQGQLERGAITINEWREAKGLKKVPWGDVWWAAGTLQPVEDAEQEEPVAPPPAIAPPAEAAGKALSIIRLMKATKAIEYGGAEHEALWKKFDERAAREERPFKAMVVGLFEEQTQDIVANLHATAGKNVTKAIEWDEVFDLDVWIEIFKERALPQLRSIVGRVGQEVFGELDAPGVFDVRNPEVTKFILGRAQRFAQEVNETTWKRLKESLAEGEKDGEGIDALAARVQTVMGDRIRSSAETIARTEVIGASNGGALEAAIQSGVVEGKTWIATYDANLRDSHLEAHLQTVGINEDFSVGGGKGPAPGQIGKAAEDINCRCTMTWVLKEGKNFSPGIFARLQALAHGNGHH